MTGAMDDAGACPECDCLPGDWTPGWGPKGQSYAEAMCRDCDCDECGHGPRAPVFGAGLGIMPPADPDSTGTGPLPRIPG